ncbi:hypothetical protein MES4922_10247 [Mesorhizobium ventifaucium]|uniref:Redoxin domain-containing protein n=2 Tax=Mesorhizobium ventifaucium TaxID=666020 RepID=A0ABN8JEN7_9HYPH|nr:hypothetical protein MES4922_10247 [Mesorhizobium ventifaucium]
MQLQDKYQTSGFEVVGVAASEEDPTAEETRTSLDAWLIQRFPNLNYRIAFDYTGEMNRPWMKASSSLGIPTSFLVDRDGRIAFIGHPAELDDVLPKVISAAGAAAMKRKPPIKGGSLGTNAQRANWR